MNKDIKYLIETIQRFDVTDSVYSNEDEPIIDQTELDNMLSNYVETDEELYELVAKRLKENNEHPKLNDIDISNVTCLSGLFNDSPLAYDGRNYNKYLKEYGVSSKNIRYLDLSRWCTKNVTDMRFMFYGLTNLQVLRLDRWDTSNVTDMSYMFCHCSGLSSLNVSMFKTQNVMGMEKMFYNCQGLTELDVSNFKMQNVKKINDMFAHCLYLLHLDVSNWDTRKVDCMWGLFDNCQSLLELDISNFDLTNVSGLYYMFRNNIHLQSVQLPDFQYAGMNTEYKGIDDTEFMFAGCSNLKNIIMKNFNITHMNTDHAKQMFAECHILSNIDMPLDSLAALIRSSSKQEFPNMFKRCPERLIDDLIQKLKKPYRTIANKLKDLKTK